MPNPNCDSCATCGETDSCVGVRWTKTRCADIRGPRTWPSLVRNPVLARMGFQGPAIYNPETPTNSIQFHLTTIAAVIIPRTNVKIRYEAFCTCQRCKRKKIKCDKGEPACYQCNSAQADCQYVERRQRPRLAQQRVAVSHLTERLQLLEKQISNTNTESSPPGISVESVEPPETETSIESVPSPRVSVMAGDGRESWIYRLASDVRRNFQSQATPVTTPTPRIDDAMSALNDALDELGKLKIRTDACKVDLSLTPKEVNASLDTFVFLVKNMVVPEIFAIPIDVELLRIIPSIMKSPYVNIDPGVYVMYYNAIYYGLHQMRGPGDPVAQGMYLKVLEAIPKWLDASGDTDMDGHTAALSAWTAINNHDYQLGWKLHLKCCHYVKTRKIDQLDVHPAKTFEEEDSRDGHRYLYWYVLATDMLFRLFYGKPTVMRWVPSRVKPPSILCAGRMHPSVFQVTVAVVWIRSTLMTAEMLNEIDNSTLPDANGEFLQKVDDFCKRLEDLMAEWKLEAALVDTSISEALRYLLADHVMTIHAIIVGIKRLVRPAGNPYAVDAIARRAARRVTQITLDFNVAQSTPDRPIVQSVCVHFINFYPFCAVFSLYEYILGSTDPDDCEQDVCLLERIGVAMAEASISMIDFKALAATINALNKVSRTIQDERRKAKAAGPVSGDIANIIPDFNASVFASHPNFPFHFEDVPQPLGFVRALESDFVARNWHEGWWDVGDGMEDPIHDVTQR
ncbi:hypothetical protein GQ44DRAFT_741061 [Phaeosphaeriaceae sp. PMI808]|nr:hypothetical protein GQ44DRAFT_741061 [Phaeosphaeriaceae sp. PMI808]